MSKLTNNREILYFQTTVLAEPYAPDVFFEISLQIGYIWHQRWSKNAKLDGNIFFAKRMWVFKRKNSESIDGQNLEMSHSIGQKQPF
jgi:hypothetical protein